MDSGSKSAAATAAPGTAGAVKERIFSVIKKASQEGITDGKRMLWIDFTPNVVAVKREDGYVVWLWRGCVVVRIYLDNEFNVVGFGVETP